MNVHCFQHVPFEDLGSIEQWLKSRTARITTTKFYEDTNLPELHQIDWLIIMGGPMSANDEQAYPMAGGRKEIHR